MRFSLVEMTESLALLLGIEDAILDQFVQTELDGILNHAKYTVAFVLRIDTDALEVPKLIAEDLIGLRLIVDATQLDHVAAIGTKTGAHHGPTTIQSNLSDRPLRKTSCPCFGTHQLCSNNLAKGIQISF